jgi:NADPH2:quinone reductase
VITTISDLKRENEIREAGAHLVLPRQAEDLPERIHAFTNGEGVDRIIEVAFEQNLDLDREILKTNGVIAAYASGAADSAPRIPFHALMLNGITIHFVLVYIMPKRAHEIAIINLNAAIELGVMRPNVGRRFELERIAEAHEAQDAGGSPGKILVELEATLR